VDIGETLYVTTAAQWRRWLEQHHSSQREIWLIFFKKDSGQPSLAYNDAVDEALCFGWIDSVVKKPDAASRAQRFTPRRPGSPVSEMNKVRMRRLVESGRMTQAGLDAAGDVLDEPFALAPDIEAALKAVPDAWENFQNSPESYRRIRGGFVEASRNRPEMFERRLAYLVKMSAANKRFGMVQ
jgi:uncharacterized protein YdeI (YjbR/CyaY-like superfamily)